MALKRSFAILTDSNRNNIPYYSDRERWACAPGWVRRLRKKENCGQETLLWFPWKGEGKPG